jgi:hypothetical protein
MYIRPESLENAVRNPELTARTPKRSMYIRKMDYCGRSARRRKCPLVLRGFGSGRREQHL